MKPLRRPDHKYFEDRADELLEEWSRQNNSPHYSDFGGGSNSLNGSLAITETKRHKGISTFKLVDNERDGSFQISGSPATGKESEGGSNQIPRRLIAEYNRIATILARIERSNPSGPLYIMVLTHYYVLGSVDMVAEVMDLSRTKVVELKGRAKEQVVLLLRDSWGN